MNRRKILDYENFVVYNHYGFIDDFMGGICHASKEDC